MATLYCQVNKPACHPPCHPPSVLAGIAPSLSCFFSQQLGKVKGKGVGFVVQQARLSLQQTAHAAGLALPHGRARLCCRACCAPRPRPSPTSAPGSPGKLCVTASHGSLSAQLIPSAGIKSQRARADSAPAAAAGASPGEPGTSAGSGAPAGVTPLST